MRFQYLVGVDFEILGQHLGHFYREVLPPPRITIPLREKRKKNSSDHLMFYP